MIFLKYAQVKRGKKMVWGCHRLAQTQQPWERKAGSWIRFWNGNGVIDGQNVVRWGAHKAEWVTVGQCHLYTGIAVLWWYALRQEATLGELAGIFFLWWSVNVSISLTPSHNKKFTKHHEAVANIKWKWHFLIQIFYHAVLLRQFLSYWTFACILWFLFLWF